MSASITAQYIEKFLDSAFLISLIGALAGAAAGALGAQHVIEKTKAREEGLKELRSTNAAIIVAFTTCNTALGFKKQLVRPMVERFNAGRSALQSFREEKQLGQRQGNSPFKFQADLIAFSAPVISIETLKTLVFDRTSSLGKPLMLVSLVENASVGLATAITKRELLMSEFKSETQEPESWPLRYFGEALSSGHTFREYADLVDVIDSYTNDLIFFSAKLSEELVLHGHALHTSFTKRFGKGAPNVNEPNFAGPKSSGLFPPESDYSAWSGWVVERAAEASAQ